MTLARLTTRLVLCALIAQAAICMLAAPVLSAKVSADSTAVVAVSAEDSAVKPQSDSRRKSPARIEAASEAWSVRPEDLDRRTRAPRGRNANQTKPSPGISPSPPYAGERVGVRGEASVYTNVVSVDSSLIAPHPALSPEYRGEGVCGGTSSHADSVRSEAGWAYSPTVGFGGEHQTVGEYAHPTFDSRRLDSWSIVDAAPPTGPPAD